ncbi:hypothetical protein KF201_1875 [Lactococcus lactis subsp. lactis]|nr:hypothetical protein KF201_1875 [Lactococcus lactis subsp. lactis]
MQLSEKLQFLRKIFNQFKYANITGPLCSNEFKEIIIKFNG